MSWCWVRCFMLRRLRLTFLANHVGAALRGCPGSTGKKPFDTPGQPRRTAPTRIHAVWIFRAVSAFVLLIAAFGHQARAQNLQANDIRAAMDARDFERAEALARELRTTDAAGFTRNNYDYLLARLLERRGARSEASALYLGLLDRGSILTQYTLWHLALLARDSGDLALERQYITRLLVSYPTSTLASRARERLIDSHFESGDYRATITLLKPIASASGVKGRSAMARLGETYAKTGQAEPARAVFNQLIGTSRDDYAL